MLKDVSELNKRAYPALVCLNDFAEELANLLTSEKEFTIQEKPLLLAAIPEGYRLELEASLQALFVSRFGGEQSLFFFNRPSAGTDLPAGKSLLVIDGMEQADSLFLDQLARAPLPRNRRSLLICSSRHHRSRWNDLLRSRIMKGCLTLPSVRHHALPWRSQEDLRLIFEHGIEITSQHEHTVHPFIGEQTFRDDFAGVFVNDTTTPHEIVQFAKTAALIAIEEARALKKNPAESACRIYPKHLQKALLTHPAPRTDRRSSLPPILEIPTT